MRHLTVAKYRSLRACRVLYAQLSEFNYFYYVVLIKTILAYVRQYIKQIRNIFSNLRCLIFHDVNQNINSVCVTVFQTIK